MKTIKLFISLISISLFILGCSPTPSPAGQGSIGLDNQLEGQSGGEDEVDASIAQMILLPELAAIELAGSPLRVVATTSIIGDVVAHVGGNMIDLTSLIGPGRDPHSFEPGAQAITIVSEADVIFVNGWDLEEGLVDDLKQIGDGVPVIEISANIEPIPLDEDSHQKDENNVDAHSHNVYDPHVWFSVPNVQQWVRNVEIVFSSLDPANAASYKSNAAAYLSELDDLQVYTESQLSQIPTEKRILVTNHDTLSYFAATYGFKLAGTVIPAASTVAEPSASDLAALIEVMQENSVCTLFTEETALDTLANTVAAELNNCPEVKVLSLYTGAIGPVGSGADSYIGMFRDNVDTIVQGLK